MKGEGGGGEKNMENGLVLENIKRYPPPSTSMAHMLHIEQS